MNIYFLSAAVVCVLVGIFHSILGEILIFNNLRVGGIVPTEAAPPLLSRNVRIIWATWHLASIFGLLIVGILLAAAVGKITLDSMNGKPDTPVLLETSRTPRFCYETETRPSRTIYSYVPNNQIFSFTTREQRNQPHCAGKNFPMVSTQPVPNASPAQCQTASAA